MRRFGSSSDAEKAIQNLDGLEIAGSRIMVEMGAPIPGALDPAMAASMLSAGFGSDQPSSLEEQGDAATRPGLQAPHWSHETRQMPFADTGLWLIVPANEYVIQYWGCCTLKLQ